MRRSISYLFVFLMLGAALIPTPAQALEVVKTFDFSLDQWQELETTEGTVTLHRIRLVRNQGRITKASFQRPYNQEYLEALQIELEYTNEDSKSKEIRVEVEWLDAEGEVIDGFGANEDLRKKSARRKISTSLSTARYGLSKAETMKVRLLVED
ncbi:MAG: hypothetical protein K8J08_18435 [Thermoanaerobaculia bacterium]|nr:hypothetical protein [Thermoanaerobaculia bacterium]